MTTGVGPLQFGTRSEFATKYGNLYYIVGLPDGREAGIFANRIEIKDGCMCAWQDAKDDKPEMLLMALPTGSWTHIYGASIMTDSPVCVDNLDPPEKATADANT